LKNLIILIFVSLLFGCKSNFRVNTQKGINFKFEQALNKESVFLHPDIQFYNDDDFLMLNLEKSFIENTSFISILEKQINENNLNSKVISSKNFKENQEFTSLYKTKLRLSSVIKSQFTSITKNTSKSYKTQNSEPYFIGTDNLKNLNVLSSKVVLLYDIKVAPSKTLSTVMLLNVATGVVEFIEEKLYLGIYKPEYLELVVFESLENIKIKAKS
jgi:hypothetical protein